MTVTASYTVSPPAPPAPPTAPIIVAPAPVLLFSAAMRNISPPWLRRIVGGAIVQGIGDPMDTEAARVVEGMRKRFPELGADEAALALLGRERRILRGPGELGSTFAVRLKKWWDAHRTRGGAYALLNQLRDFFLETNNVPIQYIANSGTSVTIAADGTTARSTVTGWTGDGEIPPQWARFFLVFYLDADTFAFPLFTAGGDPVLTAGGDPVLVDVSIYALTAEDIETICSVPREWSAAHIDRIYIILFPATGQAWGLPPGITWGGGGLTWGGGAEPVTIIC